MPQLKPVSGVVKYAFGFSLGTDPTMGFHLFVSYSGQPPSSANTTASALAAANAWNTSLAPQTDTETTLLKVTCTDLSSDVTPVGTWTGSHVGTKTGSSVLTAQNCVLINFSIGRRYRGGKPRVYVRAGLGGDISDAQHWNSTFLAAFNTAWINFTNAVVAGMAAWAGSSTLVNVSYYLGGIWKPDHLGNYKRIPTARDVPHVDTITSVSINPLVGTQRGRVRR